MQLIMKRRRDFDQYQIWKMLILNLNVIFTVFVCSSYSIDQNMNNNYIFHPQQLTGLESFGLAAFKIDFDGRHHCLHAGCHL